MIYDGYVNDLDQKAKEVRREIIKMLSEAESGHSAGPLGAADLFASLYFGGVLNYRAMEPRWEDRDRLVLSCGHYVPVWYASLALAGFFPREELATLRKLDSRLQGHPIHFAIETPKDPHKNLPGIENTSGPLGQGVSVAVGMALSGKIKNTKWKVICVSSDGEQQEGQTWEAYELASKYKLGNFCVVIDMNNIQISGKVDHVMPIEPMRKKMEGFGFEVFEMDGNKSEEILATFRRVWQHSDAPKVILMKTVPGKGVSFMENKFEWHGKPPTKEEAELALNELG